MSIQVKDGAYAWGFRVKEDQSSPDKARGSVLVEELEDPVIKDINFELKYNDLIIVVGQVGAGKTTLLYSLMEETKVIAGSTNIVGSIAYVEQEPFIYSSTVEENILFGMEYDEAKFNKVIKDAQLEHDMQELQNGKDT